MREYFKNIAGETLNVINDGYYINDLKERVDIRDLVNKAVDGTELISEFRDYSKTSNASFNKSKPAIVNNSTINTIIELRNSGISGNIVALNFASARNPGGGFETGANAQEESIARASSLYPCLIKCSEFYEFHRKQGSPLYSDKIIYSPDVPIFRDDSGKFLNKPVLCSFITSPAVNANVARGRKISESIIKETMNIRISNILKLALNKNPSAIVLGAFGCGVFGNNPKDISHMFALKLKENMKSISDIKIVFAIYDRNMTMIDIFRKELNNL
ncbi:TIGR02452 family protein [Clostridium hydrogenum]|uniref:TIGR02452 family protein n=1 Tax=Clostridium hydrogenum TaxID=2855764 RepID=UPI001F433FDB|nr:TIGR02452 family protein [Clostridium hydrogenum]